MRAYLAPILFCLLLSPTAHAGWFGNAPEPDVTLDAILTIESPFAESLDISADQLSFTATYFPLNPNEKGVKTRTHASRSDPKVWVPFAITHKYELPVEREIQIKPEWVRLDGPNRLVIRLAERLPGPGDYRLWKLTFGCEAAICYDRYGDHRVFGFEGGAPESTVPGALSLGKDRAHTLTADYKGVLMRIPFSEGSYGRKLRRASNKDNRAVQDPSGKWHISETAYATPHRGSCSDPNRSALPPKGIVDPKKHPTLAWALPFKDLRHGDLYTDYIFHPDGTRTEKSISDFTGCIALEASETAHGNGDEETRQYHYLNGKLWARDIHRYAFGKSLYEWMEFDGDQQLLFYSRSRYDHATRKEDDLYWNRLEHEAYPTEIKPSAAEWGVKKAIAEGQALLKIVTPE